MDSFYFLRFMSLKYFFVEKCIPEKYMLPLIYVFLEKILVLKCIFEKTELMINLFNIFYFVIFSQRLKSLLIY